MQLLTRYVLGELLKVFVVTLVILTTMIVLAGVVQEAIKQGLGIGPVLRLIPYILPEAMRYAVPGTVLFAAVSVYGRMAASNEIVAIKSLGISPMAFIWPLIIFASFVSLATVWLNDVAVSWGRNGRTRVIISSVEEIAYGVLETHGSFRTDRISIHVTEVEDCWLIQPRFTIHATESRGEYSITADRAQLRSNLETGNLEIHYRGARFDSVEGFEGSLGDDVYELPLDSFLQRSGPGGGPMDRSLRDIPAEIARREEDLQNTREAMATTAAFQMMTGDFESLTDAVWQHDHQRLINAQAMLHRLHTEPHRRWANGFSCLCFALVGAPWAIRRRQGDLLASFFVVFLPILLVYYPLLLYGIGQAKHGLWPPECVWLGNAMLAIGAVWLFRHVLRY